MTRKAPCSYSCQRRHRETTNRYSLEDNTSLGVVSSSITPALLWDGMGAPHTAGVPWCPCPHPAGSVATQFRFIWVFVFNPTITVFIWPYVWGVWEPWWGAFTNGGFPWCKCKQRPCCAVKVPEGQRGAFLALGPGRERSDEECWCWDLPAPWEGWHQLHVQGTK